MIQTALILAALIVAFVAEFQAAGRLLIGWAVVLIGIALLVGRIP